MPDKVDAERLWDSLMAMAEIGATAGGGSNRQALSDDDAAGRALFCQWAEAVGCQIHHDEIGNLFARLEGSEEGLPAVVMGSHLDTQPSGGRFDGVYGVLGALEVVRTLHDRGVTPRHPIEIAVWTNEEGSRFQRSMLGSAVWAGVLPLVDGLATADADGVTVADALARLGLQATRPAAPFPIAAAFELHIEQGPVLEHESLEVGVVTGVLGFRWFTLELEGQAAHAGPTPMAVRRDPAKAIAQIIDAVYALVDEAGDDARATFAQLSSTPPSPNTVPSALRCTLDIRHTDGAELDRLETAVRAAVAQAAAATGVTAQLAEENRSDPVRFDAGCIELGERAAQESGLRWRSMVSGAGHDSCNVAQVAPTSMIFVPCAGGLSHNEAESITAEQAAHGATVLLHAVLGADAR